MWASHVRESSGSHYITAVLMVAILTAPELSVRQWIKYVTYDLINTENFKLPEDYLSIPVVIVEYKHFLLADNTNICPISLNIHRQEANSETK